MDIYAILIILAVLAVVVVVWLIAQRLSARYGNIERENANIINALEKLSAQVDHYDERLEKYSRAILDKIDQTKGVTVKSAADPRSVADDSDIAGRVEATLREIVDLAQDMKSPVSEQYADYAPDARAWNVMNSLRCDVNETRDALDRSQKRLRQLGECIDDAARKLRSLDRRIKQAKRQDYAQALPEPDEMDMKL